MTAATVTSMRCDIRWLSLRVGPSNRDHKTPSRCRSVVFRTLRLQLHLPQLWLDVAGAPDSVEAVQVKARDGGLVRIGHAVPALGAGAVDERVLVGDEEGLVAVAKFRLRV